MTKVLPLSGRFSNASDEHNENLFEKIASDIEGKGYSVQVMQLADILSENLLAYLHEMDETLFSPAGIGRQKAHHLNQFVRKDEICWITGESEAGQMWLDWAAALQGFLNKRLFLGLFSFESHFAHYPPGAFYKKHLDSFKGESNRVLSMVVYLNAQWLPDDGGELLLYPPMSDDFDLDDSLQDGLKVTPALGTIVTFLSEQFPHEVLPAKRDRYSIAAWYRVNSSSNERVDPPL